MPAMMDVCSWCGTEYGQHGSLSNRCPSSKTGQPRPYQFAPLDTIQVKDVPEGSEVEMGYDGKYISLPPTTAYLTAIVVLVRTSDVIIGWSSSNSPLHLGWPPDTAGSSVKKVLQQMGLDRGWALYPDHFIHRVSKLISVSATITSQPVSSGMACASCGDFNTYGQANIGSHYVCFSCRSSGKRP